MNFDFTFYGEPVAQGRPRFNRSTGFARDPEKSRNYKEDLRAYAQKYLQDCKGKRMSDALWANIEVYKSIPKSWSKKKQNEAKHGFLWPTGKPDTDNYIKTVLDALSGVLFDDDSQIVKIVATKEYSEEPCVKVRIERIVEEV